MQSNKFGVIMAGGIGSRFWPVSVQSKPKQFHDFLGDGLTLLQQTFERMKKIAPAENIYFVINELYQDLVLTQIPEISAANLIIEPKAMNTAPCIAYATYKIHAINPNAVLFIAPSDHIIKYEDEFTRIAKIALSEAEKGKNIITLGIQPSHPETGFGYIQYEFGENQVKAVTKFTEKPEISLAKQFLRAGNYLWNSGMFIASSTTLIESFQALLPVYDKVFNHLEIYGSDKEKSYIEENYPLLEPNSIDYAVMEKSANVYVIPSSFGWSDLGTWSAIYKELDKDENLNARRGNVLTYDTNTSLIISTQTNKVIIVDGLKDYIVVDTPNVLLISKKENAQEVKVFAKDVQDQFPTIDN